MDILVILHILVVKYTLVLECACYAVRGSVYEETSSLDTVYGAILSASCKLNSWVTRPFLALAS